MKLFSFNGAARKRARGFTLVEVMIAISVVSVLGILAFNEYQGYQLDIKFTEVKDMWTKKVPERLVSLFQTRGNTYGTLTADAAGKTQITSRGIRQDMPWSPLDLWTVSTAGTTTAVSFTFSTAGAGANAAQLATEFRTNGTILGVNPMVTAVGGAGNNVIVTYRNPS